MPSRSGGTRMARPRRPRWRPRRPGGLASAGRRSYTGREEPEGATAPFPCRRKALPAGWMHCMIIDVEKSDVVTVYQALVGVVNPRPIAWVTTLDEEGRVNLAPFSFFNAFGANPPVVVFSPTNRRDGSKKDTLRNLEVRARIRPERGRRGPRRPDERDREGAAARPERGRGRRIVAVDRRPRSGRLGWRRRRCTWNAASVRSFRWERAPSPPTWSSARSCSSTSTRPYSTPPAGLTRASSAPSPASAGTTICRSTDLFEMDRP